MEELKRELQQLQKLEQKEEGELKTFLQDLAQQEEHREAVQNVYGEVERFIELNQEILELTKLMEQKPENFREIYSKLNSLISKHNNLGNDILNKLKELGVPEQQLQILYETDQKMENIDEQIVEQIGERRTEQAQKILDNRPTIYFKTGSLQKFISAVKREQTGNGAEVPGVFGFKQFKDGYILNKFLELENTNPNYGSFNLNEQINYILENYGNERNIIFAHSHPARDFSHSGTDKDLIKKANSIGVIGVPKNKSVYTVPEALDNGSWINLPSKVVEKGEPISEQALKSRFPEIKKYNEALKQAISKGNEKRWPNLI